MILYFVCDESGAKGYADNAEQYPGETGVFAGYFVPEFLFDEVSAELKSIAETYSGSGKPHLRELPSDDRAALRGAIFSLIKTKELPCTYEAIHAEGYRHQHQRMAQFHGQIKELFKSDVDIHHRTKPRQLHVELFQGLFFKAAGFFLDFFRIYCDALQICVDHVDLPVLKEFQQAAEETHDLSDRTELVKGYDRRSGEVVRRQVTIRRNIDGLPVLRDLQEMNYDICVGPGHLTLAADVLANSLHHLFRGRLPEHVGDALHTKDAVRHHDLFGCFYGFMDEETDGQRWFSDSVLMHPRKIPEPTD